jgi:hypothetical protein
MVKYSSVTFMTYYGNKLSFTLFEVKLETDNGDINIGIKQWEIQVMSGH